MRGRIWKHGEGEVHVLNSETHKMLSVTLFQRDLNGLIPIIYLTFYQDTNEIIETQHLTHMLLQFKILLFQTRTFRIIHHISLDKNQ